MNLELLLRILILVMLVVLVVLNVRQDKLNERVNNLKEHIKSLNQQMWYHLQLLSGLVEDKKALDTIVWDVLDFIEDLQNNMTEIAEINELIIANIIEDIDETDEDYYPLEELFEGFSVQLAKTNEDLDRNKKDLEGSLRKYSLGEFEIVEESDDE